MAKKYLVIGGLVVLILASWLAFGSGSTESNEILITPNRGPFSVQVTTTGELRAKNSTSIRGPEGIRSFRIYNVTIQRLVPEGTVVEKGDFIAELDRSEISNSLQDALLEVEEEKSAYEIAKLDSSLTLSQSRDDLINQKYALEEFEIAVEQSKYESPAVQRQAQIDYDRALRELEQAKKRYTTQVRQAEAELREIEADLKQAQRDLERIQRVMEQFTIYAPENGMVIYKRNRDGSKLAEGSSISAWDPVVAELPDFSVMESVTYVNEVDIQKIREGQTVDIGLDAMPDKKLSGLVTNVANIGEQRPNSDSKVFQVVVRINETDTTLRPAMTTSNVTHVDSVNDALYVPLETIYGQDSLSFVFKREGLETVMQQVILGMMNENDVVIREGLTLDDRLYYSIPSDTSGIRKVYLPDEILRNYREEETGPEEIVPEEQTIEQDQEISEEFGSRTRMQSNSGSGNNSVRQRPARQ